MKLKEIKLKDLDGQETIFDASKILGNYIYTSTGDLGMLEVAQDIYKKGEADLTPEQKAQVIELLKSPRCGIIAVLKQEIIKQLNT